VDHHHNKTLGRFDRPGEKETSMSDMYGQTEKALSKGADYVDQARGDVKNKCGVLSGNIQTMMAGWGGQGASAFNNLMISWDQKQETILKALDQLSASMKETERDNVSTDENQSATHANLQGRLG
jgi:WXG100 family type VII secretion target